MLRLVRLIILAGILASSHQISSAEPIQNIYQRTEIRCPQTYELTSSQADWLYQGWDRKAEFPFLKYELKKSGGIWDIKCLFGFVEHSPNGGIRQYNVFATLVKRIRAGNCSMDNNNPFVNCYPPTDQGVDVYQPGIGTPEPPLTVGGVDVYQPGAEAPPPPPPIDRSLDVYQPGRESPQPPPPPPGA